MWDVLREKEQTIYVIEGSVGITKEMKREKDS